MAKVCPICGREYEGFSALSRRDNKTEICSECGMEEAMIDFLNDAISRKDNERREATNENHD